MSDTIAHPTTTLRIIVPTVPGPACSPNARASWHVVYRARNELKTAAAWAACLSVPVEQRPWFGAEPVTLQIRVIWPRGRKRMDDDNAIAACKGARDALNGIAWADDRQVTTLPIVQQTWSEADRPAEYEHSGVIILDIQRGGGDEMTDDDTGAQAGVMATCETCGGELREIDQMIDDLLKISGRLNIDDLGDGEYRFGVTTRNNSLARVAPDWRDALRVAYAAVVGE